MGLDLYMFRMSENSFYEYMQRHYPRVRAWAVEQKEKNLKYYAKGWFEEVIFDVLAHCGETLPNAEKLLVHFDNEDINLFTDLFDIYDSYLEETQQPLLFDFDDLIGLPTSDVCRAYRDDFIPCIREAFADDYPFVREAGSLLSRPYSRFVDGGPEDPEYGYWTPEECALFRPFLLSLVDYYDYAHSDFVRRLHFYFAPDEVEQDCISAESKEKIKRVRYAADYLLQNLDALKPNEGIFSLFSC